MIGGLAHAGQTVVVTSGGKPWIKPGPALPVKPGKSTAAFKARLTRISPAPIPGASGVLSPAWLDCEGQTGRKLEAGDFTTRLTTGASASLGV